MQAPTTAPRPRTILQIDGDSASCDRRSEILSRYGFRVLNAPTARMALALADAERPDLVLSNVMLPDASGFLVCRQMRAVAPPVPVVLISDELGGGNLTSELFGGACEYLIEPVAVLDLIMSVMRHLP